MSSGLSASISMSSKKLCTSVMIMYLLKRSPFFSFTNGSVTVLTPTKGAVDES